VSGVGRDSSRVILLTDTSSRIPVTIQPSGQRAVLAGDNTMNPPILFLENDELVRPGDRVVSSGDGGVFPADLLVGQVALGTDRRLRVRLAADYERLEFLRVMRSQPAERITDPGALIAPVDPPVYIDPEALRPAPLTRPEELARTEPADG
jgi:rod shape-determining protein MreC